MLFNLVGTSKYKRMIKPQVFVCGTSERKAPKQKNYKLLTLLWLISLRSAKDINLISLGHSSWNWIPWPSLTPKFVS